jgi:protease-4
MWKFFAGLAVGIVVAILGSLIIFLAIGRLFSSKPPSIAGDSALVLSLSGEIPEVAPVELPPPFSQNDGTVTVRDLWTSLHEAASDHRIRAIVLKPQSVTAGWGKLQEVRQELLGFKKSGKPIYAYLQSGGSREYYLASVADKIFTSPDDSLEVKGFNLEEMFFKNTLDKFGIQVQVDHMGKYKDAGDTFTKTGMTPETKEVLNSVVDQIYNDFCTVIGQGRHKTADQVKTLVDAGPFMASEAKNDGLIDVLAYENDLYSDLNHKVGVSELKKVSINTYARATPGKGDRIAILVGEGDIVRGDPNEGYGNPTVISSGGFSKLIRRVRNDSSVKGVILRVDSPGGDAVASDEILHELKLLDAAKPVIISMSDLAASGGYLISMTGDKIVAYPDTITGSIGVLYVRPNFKGLYDKLGITTDNISRGKMANIDSLSNPLSDAETQKLHESIATTYRAFLTKVAGARNKSIDQVDAIAQGHVWMGAQARDNGLVDNLGGLDEAVAMIRAKAKLSAGGETNLVMYPPRKSLLEILSSSSPDSLEDAFAESRTRKLLPGLPTGLNAQSLLQGGLLSRMPYMLTVR